MNLTELYSNIITASISHGIQYFHVSRIQYFPWYLVFSISMYPVSSISHGIQFSEFPCIPYPVFPMVFSFQYSHVSRIQYPSTSHGIQYFPWYSVFSIPMYPVSSISHGIQFSVFPCIPYPVFPMLFSFPYSHVSRIQYPSTSHGIQYFPWYSVFRIPMYSISSISHGIQFLVFRCIPYPVS